MPKSIILDSSPLSTVTKRRGVEEADACKRWMAECILAGHKVYAPAIAFYEVARELVRANNVAGKARLDSFCGIPDRYLSLTDSA